MLVRFELVILPVKSVRLVQLKFIVNAVRVARLAVHALRLSITGRATGLAPIDLLVRRSMVVALLLLAAQVRTGNELWIDRVEAAVRIESIDRLDVIEFALCRRAGGQFGGQLAVVVDAKRTVEEVAFLNEKRQTVVHQISEQIAALNGERNVDALSKLRIGTADVIVFRLRIGHNVHQLVEVEFTVFHRDVAQALGVRQVLLLHIFRHTNRVHGAY